MGHFEMLVAGQETPKISEDQVHLVENFVQLYLAETDLRAGGDHEFGETEVITQVMRNGDEFRHWAETEEGRRVIEDYASRHTEEDIEKRRDMDAIADAFHAYHSRTIH